ncbi:hypothetical protein PVK06_009453 [Gossypium arboreum]|uniref:Uncharacterized protein n=1 Tax=Gossypium arboreum TaxID=29729 RepID=A0ABR0QMH8_GOSAR|nr:hypothetical protein PVK06_009453 [Gossypium arboreum]
MVPRSSLCQHLSQAVDYIAISLVFKVCNSSLCECMASVLVISTTPYWCKTLSKGLRGWVIFSLISKGPRIGIRFFWIGTRLRLSLFSYFFLSLLFFVGVLWSLVIGHLWPLWIGRWCLLSLIQISIKCALISIKQ